MFTSKNFPCILRLDSVKIEAICQAQASYVAGSPVPLPLPPGPPVRLGSVRLRLRLFPSVSIR